MVKSRKNVKSYLGLNASHNRLAMARNGIASLS